MRPRGILGAGWPPTPAGGPHRRSLHPVRPDPRRRRPVLRRLRFGADATLRALRSTDRLRRLVLHPLWNGPDLDAGRSGRRRPRGPPPGQRAVRRPHRLHAVRGTGRPGAGPRHADRLLHRRAPGRRAVRRRGGEVHRRRGDGAVRRAGGHRDRRAALRAGRAGAAAGARPVHARRQQRVRRRHALPRRCRDRRGAGRRRRRPRRRPGDRGRRRGQHRLPAAVGRAAGRRAGLRRHVRADQGRDPLPRPAGGDAARPVHTDRGVAGRGAGAAPAPRPRARLHAAGRPRARARPARQRAAPFAARPHAAGRHGLRPRGHRQEPPHPRALQARRPADRPAGDLAHRPVPAVRRERRVRRARRHRQGRGGHPRHGHGRHRGAAARLGRRRAGRAGRGRPAHRGAATAGRSVGHQAPARGGGVGRGAGSSSRWPPAGPPCSSSRTCTGPTTRCCASSS